MYSIQRLDEDIQRANLPMWSEERDANAVDMINGGLGGELQNVPSQHVLNILQHVQSVNDRIEDGESVCVPGALSVSVESYRERKGVLSRAQSPDDAQYLVLQAQVVLDMAELNSSGNRLAGMVYASEVDSEVISDNLEVILSHHADQAQALRDAEEAALQAEQERIAARLEDLERQRQG